MSDARKQPSITDVNQREYFRFSISENGQFRLVIDTRRLISSWGDCTVLDMSGGGCCIITPLNIPNHTKHIEFCLEIVVLNKTYPLGAEIVWKGKEKAGYRYGLKWVGLDDKQRDDLITALISIEKRKEQKHTSVARKS